MLAALVLLCLVCAAIFLLKRPGSRRPYFPGIALGAVAAGPAFLLGLGLGALSWRPERTVPLDFDPDLLPALMGLMLAAVIVGGIIAVPLAMLGAMALSGLGQDNIGLRHPAFWALTGAFAAAGPAACIGVGDAVFLTAFAFTGAVVASICRWRTSWVT
ncbi:hypothetical protein J8I29_09075 [Labrys sp. LIt4]|uniref:hypothetical protein n=1 Tax=Labrys sp. LIt4 TaxID=2821355 RepID=UPI001AE0055D|nr:hypothetical protein [Labrys sp. LIt4]MBP0579457.1 hypothetical protein [Labrys sp. LIt4]